MKLPVGYVPGVGLPKPASNAFGERMLQKMGWQSGDGLGRNRDGMREAIQVKKKEDTVGIGANVSWNWADRYWEQAFDSAARSIEGGNVASASSSSSTSSSCASDASSSGYSSCDSDSDAAQTEQRARARGTAGTRLHRDGTVANGNDDERRIAASLARRSGHLAHGRGAKLARIAAQEAAMLLKLQGGSAAAAAVAAAAAPSGARKRRRATAELATTDGMPTAAAQCGSKVARRKVAAGERGSPSPSPAAAGGDANAPAAAPARRPLVIVVGGGGGNEAAPAPASCSYPSDWWGAKKFVWGGVLGSGAPLKPAGRRGFDEGDQEALYHLVHGNQRAGKRGLGKGQISGAVAGARWAGTKVTFNDELDKDSGGDTAAAVAVRQSGTEAAAECDAERRAAHGGGCVSQLTGVKWKKVIGQALDASPEQRLRVKALVRGVVAALHAQGQLPARMSKEERGKLAALLLKKVGGSSRFSLQGRVVARV